MAFAREEIADILRQSGGSYGMARLSGMLKRERADVS